MLQLRLVHGVRLPGTSHCTQAGACQQPHLPGRDARGRAQAGLQALQQRGEREQGPATHHLLACVCNYHQTAGLNVLLVCTHEFELDPLLHSHLDPGSLPSSLAPMPNHPPKLSTTFSSSLHAFWKASAWGCTCGVAREVRTQRMNASQRREVTVRRTHAWL